MNRTRTVVAVSILVITAVLVILTWDTHAALRATPPKTAIILLENHPASKIVGNANAPYLNKLITQGLRLTNYTEAPPIVGPSLPDYLQLVTGSNCGRTTDSVQFADPGISGNCPTTLWSQLSNAGVSWALYAEKIPTACSHLTTANVSGGDRYVMRHVPGPMFASLPSCSTHVLPFSVGAIPNPLPTVTFWTPSICNDMHGISSTSTASCVAGSQALIKRGDTWVSKLVPQLLAQGESVFITFDESGTLYAVEVGAGVTHGTDSTAYNHFGWLRMVEARYGLPYLGGAAIARAIP